MALIDIKREITLNIPHEPNEYIKVRQLTGPEMEEAESAQSVDAINKYGNAIQAMMEWAERNRNETETDEVPYKSYAPSVLFKYAIKGWSYQEPCTPENISRLDVATRDWLHKEIVTMNKRPLDKQTS